MIFLNRMKYYTNRDLPSSRTEITCYSWKTKIIYGEPAQYSDE